MPPADVELRPIRDEDAASVSRFLHTHLNPRIPPERWAALMAPPWPAHGPNHGFQLVADAQVVGAYVAVYAQRELGGARVSICNLAAFCVLPPHRTHSIRLLRAVLGQRGYEFTDLSPSGNVVELNRRLGFTALDTRTRITPNLPAPRRPGVRLITDPDAIGDAVAGRDREIFTDHRRAPAARHIVVTRADEYAYLVVRKDRRKGLPLFATPLYAGGSSALLEYAWPQVATLLLVGHGTPFTLAEPRVLGFTPRWGVDQRRPRSKMFRSRILASDDLDYLYSELALLQW